MKPSAPQLLNLALVLGAFSIDAALYGRLPDPVPTHWNMAGVANGFTAKPWGAFLLPLEMAGIWLLMLALPRIAPKGFRLEPFARVYGILQGAILGFFFLINAFAGLAALGVAAAADRLPLAALGMLFMVLGNYMGKLTKNFFVGIRTPWTLASDEVWLRTHRLGGKLFVAAGLVILAAALLGAGPMVILPVILGTALITVIYSYVVYRRVEGFKAAAE